MCGVILQILLYHWILKDMVSTITVSSSQALCFSDWKIRCVWIDSNRLKEKRNNRNVARKRKDTLPLHLFQSHYLYAMKCKKKSSPSPLQCCLYQLLVEKE